MAKGAATLLSVQRQSAVTRHPNRSKLRTLVYVVRLPLVLLSDRLRSWATRLPIRIKERLVQLPMLAFYFLSVACRPPAPCPPLPPPRASAAARICAPAAL